MKLIEAVIQTVHDIEIEDIWEETCSFQVKESQIGNKSRMRTYLIIDERLYIKLGLLSIKFACTFIFSYFSTIFALICTRLRTYLHESECIYVANLAW